MRMIKTLDDFIKCLNWVIHFLVSFFPSSEEIGIASFLADYLCMIGMKIPATELVHQLKNINILVFQIKMSFPRYLQTAALNQCVKFSVSKRDR